MLRRLFVAKWPRLSVRRKSTAAPESPAAHKEDERLFRSVRTFLRSEVIKDLKAIVTVVGGLGAFAGSIYYIVGSELSRREKIRNLTKVLQKEREIRIGIQKECEIREKDIEKARELRKNDTEQARELRAKHIEEDPKLVQLTKDLQKERELHAMDIEKARELREKDIEEDPKLVQLAKDLQKERELREKDAAIWRALRAAYESELSELRTAKLEIENASRGK